VEKLFEEKCRKEDKVDIRQRQKVPLHLQEVSRTPIREVLENDMMVIGKTLRTRAGRSLRETVHNVVCKVIRQPPVWLRDNNSQEVLLLLASSFSGTPQP
jgi:hypothetical protein